MPRAEARGCLLAEESSIAKRRFKCQWKDIEEKIEKAGVTVASKESEEYDAIVEASYREREGGKYIPGGVGTIIQCEIRLYDVRTKNTWVIAHLFGSTRRVVRGSLYWDAVQNLKQNFHFTYLTEIFAIGLRKPVDVSGLVKELNSMSPTRRIAAFILKKANWVPQTPEEKALWDSATR